MSEAVQTENTSFTHILNHLEELRGEAYELARLAQNNVDLIVGAEPATPQSDGTVPTDKDIEQPSVISRIDEGLNVVLESTRATTRTLKRLMQARLPEPPSQARLPQPPSQA